MQPYFYFNHIRPHSLLTKRLAFYCISTQETYSSVIPLKSVPFGMYCLMSPFVFSLVGPTPISVPRADTSMVSGITRLTAERASLPTYRPKMMVSTVTVSCIMADDTNDAHR